MDLRTPTAAMVCLMACIAQAGGSIFRYVEPDGTIVYSNVAPKAARELKTAKKLESSFRLAPQLSAPAVVSVSTSRACDTYAPLMEDASSRYKIPVHLVKAIAHAESAFDPMAVSVVGASGLMQLMPQTAREMFVTDIFDPQQNIEGGVRYLRVLANEFEGDMVKMIAAYNAGPDAVKKYGGAIPPYSETQLYVRKVLSLYFQYRNASSMQLTKDLR
jgi:soluble lytic murein transglycosylase-like protein